MHVRSIVTRCLVLAMGCAAAAPSAYADAPPSTQPSTQPAAAAAPVPAIAPASSGLIFEVFPADICLKTSRDQQAIVARVIQPDGVSHDVTSQIQFILPEPALVKAEGNMLRPLVDGAGEIKVKYQDQVAILPVKVQDAKADRPVSFKLDVMPVFLKAGCNSGACHGSARGKDGFHLSLFGYDPDGDYQRLTRELSTRRINLALPAESLLLTKATGKVPHTGGTRFKQDSPLYATIMRWLDAGAPEDPPTVATPTSMEILPKQMVLEGEGARQQMTVRRIIPMARFAT